MDKSGGEKDPGSNTPTSRCALYAGEKDLYEKRKKREDVTPELNSFF